MSSQSSQSSQSKKIPTFRPYLTEPEILYLLSLVQNSQVSPEQESCRIKLRKLTIQISENLNSPAYLAAPKTEEDKKKDYTQSLNREYESLSQNPLERIEKIKDSWNVLDQIDLFDYRDKTKILTAEEKDYYQALLMNQIL